LLSSSVLAFLAAFSWFIALPHLRPPLRTGERYGVDVSRHQGVIQWDRVAHDGIKVAYVKATEGGDLVDDRFVGNWSGAKRAGLEVGAYHFFTLCRPGADQARNFLSAAPPDRAALPPAVDLELGGNCRARPRRETLLDELAVFLSTVEDAWGRQVVVYTNDDFDTRYPVRQLGRPLWEVARPFRPNDARWRIWQLHGFAHVDGISSRVDLDVVRLPRVATGG
jgi:lysozyme